MDKDLMVSTPNIAVDQPQKETIQQQIEMACDMIFSLSNRMNSSGPVI